MRRKANMGKGAGWVLLAALLAGTASLAATVKQNEGLKAGREDYDKSDYAKAVQELQAAAAREPQNGEIELLLTKSYMELGEHDAAIASAERAVTIDPQSSVYHLWLGKAYGEKADHSSMFSALGLARKTRKEFQTAVQLDDRNYSARQALIEYDCSAPSIVGGGEDKAQPEIAKLESMDASEWHYAKGNCRRQKKDFAEADAEFQMALQSHPKSADLIYDIGDYEVKRGEAAQLMEVAELGERAAPGDPRGLFYRAVGLILKNEKPRQAERDLREYLASAPKRNGYPRYSAAHKWMGRLYEGLGEKENAVNEYQAALQLDPKDKNAREALKRLRRE
ncbi:MAG TPA: tetratricopeptide repeat protein [Candidatus Solibacter sp.]|nr:tetratricopeptide repeat protein [Candidatus Solibacter sp.]